jgi:tetratricopeptide (TPR) repeat protein
LAHADHELARARMRREAEALEAIGPPAVPKLHDTGVLADGRAWIAMDRVTGTNVADLIALGSLRIDQAIAIGDAILASLARIHAASFVHRDLKPDNLVRAKGGTVVILDLGLARKIPNDPDDPTRAGVQVGSLEYMAPEQMLDAASAGVRADIYGFGCVLYELCAGRPPFVGDANALERAHAALRPPPLAALAAVPPPLEALVHDCLAKMPDRRPGSVVELRARLAALRDATPSLQRVQRSVSLIRDSKQPVVLLWAELPKVDRTLLGMLAARKIAVISHRGRRVLGGVVGADHADPAGAAIAAARDLAAAGARVALHLDALTITTGATSTTITGAAAQKPDAWLPTATWTGILISRALAAVLQAPTRATDIPGFVMLGEPSQTAELFGRDALISELATDAAPALANKGPGLAVLVGDPGIGKSAIAAALAPQLADLGARVHVGEVPPPGSGRPSYSALAPLVGEPHAPVVRAIGDALRALAREQPTAIIVDNVHLADPDLLDALEYATLGGESLPLWVCAIATPRLDQRRPGFGSRAERHQRYIVPPLDEDSAVALTTELLKPAEYPPLRALRQIASIARGNPMHLTSLVREIHDRGAIRTRPNGEHFLDTTALDALPTIALGPWLAARELAHVSAELVALARVCAVLGDEIDRAELAAVVEKIERYGGAATTIDVDVGLRELELAGIVVASGPGYAFRQALLQEGIYATTNEDERRAIHAAALEFVRTPERIARHAEAIGENAVATLAFVALGERAEREHQALDADQAFEGALRNETERDALRGLALVGRARARCRMQRLTDAIADCEEAISIAREIGDVALEIEALLEHATALDWTQDFENSKRAVLVAHERFVKRVEPRFDIPIRIAIARSCFREQQFEQAVAGLREAIAAARAARRTRDEIDAGLLLGVSLIGQNNLDQAERALARVIELCEASGDRFHLGVAYNNRTILWSARGDIERVASDLRVVIQLAREAGQAFVERAATYNLAEDRLWLGELDEAIALAKRSYALQAGHGEGSTRLDEMLLARVFAARDDRDELARALATLSSYELDDEEQRVFNVLRAFANDDRVALDRALDDAEPLSPPHRLELLHLVALRGGLGSDRRAAAVDLAKSDPIWSRRIGVF